MQRPESDSHDDSVPEKWSRVADEYDSYVGKASALVSAKLIGMAHDLCLLDESSSRVLEFGAGTGSTTHQLAASFPRLPILATDISPRMLEVLAAKDTTGRIETGIVDMNAPSSAQLGESKYTHIFMTMAAGLLTNPIDAARIWKRFLKPGGVLAIATWDFSKPVGPYDIWKRSAQMCDSSYSPTPLSRPGFWQDGATICDGMATASYIDIVENQMPLELDFSPFPSAYLEWWFRGVNPFSLRFVREYRGDLSQVEVAIGNVLEQEYKVTEKIPLHATLVLGRT